MCILLEYATCDRILSHVTDSRPAGGNAASNAALMLCIMFALVGPSGCPLAPARASTSIDSKARAVLQAPAFKLWPAVVTGARSKVLQSAVPNAARSTLAPSVLAAEMLNSGAQDLASHRDGISSKWIALWFMLHVARRAAIDACLTSASCPSRKQEKKVRGAVGS